MSRSHVCHHAAATGHRALLAAAALLLAGCSAGTIREQFRPASPREAYVESLRTAGLDRTALGRDWTAAGARAVAAPAAVTLPLREQGTFAADEATAVAWRVRPRQGQRLTVRVEAEADSGTRLFHELFAEQAVDGGGAPARRVVGSGDSLGATYQVDANDAGASYVLRLQPELLRAVRWTVTFEGGPSLGVFPVQGRDTRAVQSFWGADRDAGARAHQGIDIFARRGTPAVAAVDGVVRRVGENRLGGNVVFLYDPAGGQSLYYAHLDSQTVVTGQPVRAGDTLGFVGNTGNARTTAPHLHFGVYRRGTGAIDPLPFVDTRRLTPATPGRDTLLVGEAARTRGRGRVALRTGPSAASDTVASLAPSTVLAVDGAASAGWLRVRLPDLRAGYVPAAAVERAEEPVARTRLAAAARVRARPAADAPALHVTAAATEARVLGRFPGYAWVELADGARGWVAEE